MTVGTKKGKSYLNSHPAIMATFQSQFLYGIHLNIRITVIVLSTVCLHLADDFHSKQPKVSDPGNAACRTSNSNGSTSTKCNPVSSTVKNIDTSSNTSSSRSTDTGKRSIVLQSTVKKQGSKTSALLKNSSGTVVATGDIIAEGQQLHGESLREGCVKIMITDVVTPEAKSWFPDKFGEDTLEKGTFVEWPTDSITHLNAISPLATRSRRNMKVD